MHGASRTIWAAVLVIIAGTIVGGIALIYWNWPMFWIGVGVFVAGCVGGYVAGIMDTVTEFGPVENSQATSGH
jgi:hypothetical protein